MPEAMRVKVVRTAFGHLVVEIYDERDGHNDEPILVLDPGEAYALGANLTRAAADGPDDE